MEGMKKRGRPKTKEDVIKSIMDEGEPLNLPNVDHQSVSITSSDNSYLEPGFDPWENIIEENSDRKKYYHRAINIKPSNMSKRKYQGYEIVPGQKNNNGDLILARMPWELREKRVKAKAEKTRRITKAVKERFKEEVNKAGFKPFDERR